MIFFSPQTAKNMSVESKTCCSWYSL